MSLALQVLALHKATMLDRFLVFNRRPAKVPQNLSVPSDPNEALRMGIILGRKEGYRQGVVDGTQLGLDVGQEVGAPGIKKSENPRASSAQS